MTLEAGGLRVTVDPDDLEPAVGLEPAVPPRGDARRDLAERADARCRPRTARPARRVDNGRRRPIADGGRQPSGRGGAGSASSGPGPWPRRSTCAAPGSTRRSSVLGRYLDDAALAGLERVTVVHGLGTGALRDAVRASAAANPLVREVRPGERGEGGDGATIVSL